MASMAARFLAYTPAVVTKACADGQAKWTACAEDLEGAVLFCDVSGFTALSERLASEGDDGAERLVDVLNEYFGTLIEHIVSSGGDVMKFAGDALLAIWTTTADGDDVATATLRAAQCAADIQADLNRRDSDGPLLHMGIGSGPMALLQVGGTFNRCDFMVCGPPLFQIGPAVSAASPDLVVMSAEAWSAVAGRASGRPTSYGSTDDLMILDEVTDPVAKRPLAVVDVPDGAVVEKLQRFMPRSVVKFVEECGGEGYVAERRTVSVIFINVKGLDLSSAACLPVVDSVINTLQRSLYKYRGSINKVLLDDKGFVVLAGVGLPPLTHEDNPLRACKAALSAQSALTELGVSSGIGITTGRVFCGIVGSAARREYTMMGDTVNTAARFMAAADGTVLCDEATRNGCGSLLTFQREADRQFKGKSAAMAVYRPVLDEFARRSRKMKSLQTMARTNITLIGRQAEVRFLQFHLSELLGGAKTAGGLVVFEGERGIGKSRILEEGKRMALHERDAGASGLHFLNGRGDPTETTAAFVPWRTVFRDLFDAAGADNADLCHFATEHVAGLRVDALTAAVEASHAFEYVFGTRADPVADSEALATAVAVSLVCLLCRGADFGVDPAVADWAELVLAGLAASGLPRKFPGTPTLVMLQDLHWFDTASLRLIHAVRAALPTVLIVGSTGPYVGTPPAEFTALIEGNENAIKLDPLPKQVLSRLVCERLGTESLPSTVEDFITDACGGNPFFAQELAGGLVESGVLVVDGTAATLTTNDLTLRSVELPPAIVNIVTNRLDRLTPGELFIVKVASVFREPQAVSKLAFIVSQEGHSGTRVSDDIVHLIRRDVLGVVGDDGGGGGSGGGGDDGDDSAIVLEPTSRIRFAFPFVKSVAFTHVTTKIRNRILAAGDKWDADPVGSAAAGGLAATTSPHRSKSPLPLSPKSPGFPELPDGNASAGVDGGPLAEPLTEEETLERLAAAEQILADLTERMDSLVAWNGGDRFPPANAYVSETEASQLDAALSLGFAAGEVAFRRAPSAYYSWPLEARRNILRAHSTHHLCKSMVFQSKKSGATDTSDPTNSLYYCVILQYTTRIETNRLEEFVASMNPDMGRRRFHFRLANEEENEKLTGFSHNAVSPIGMATDMPYIISKSITELDPPYIWLGAGEVDNKIRLPVERFIELTGAYVADITSPLERGALVD